LPRDDCPANVVVPGKGAGAAAFQLCGRAVRVVDIVRIGGEILIRIGELGERLERRASIANVLAGSG